MTQLELFAGPRLPADVHSSGTSRQAAQSVSSTAATIRQRVLTCIAGSGRRGCTDHELASRLQMIPDTARARRCELPTPATSSTRATAAPAPAAAPARYG